MTIGRHLAVGHHRAGAREHHRRTGQRHAGLSAFPPGAMALRPVAGEADGEAGTAGDQLHLPQRHALGEQILFAEGVEHHIAHRRIVDCRQRGGDRLRPPGDNRPGNQRGFSAPLALN
ncbi:Uncharacterised protein [Klebsiella pneumoniae]|nr:Uncharacterised protein [Klebsiella pneumoniae]